MNKYKINVFELLGEIYKTKEHKKSIIKNLTKEGYIHGIDYFFIKELDNFLLCEVCGKKSEFVRFEGSEEKNICDNCLYKLKGGSY